MRKNLVLCLGSGGVRGLAHLGVFKSLYENNIPIDAIYGCSVGSLIGAFIADAWKPDALIELTQTLSPRDFIDLDISFSGYIGGKKLNHFVSRHIKTKKIEDLNRPLVALAANVRTGQPTYFKKGVLSDVVQASCSIPRVFQPKKIDDIEYLDGDLCTPLPVSQAREDYGTNAVILAVNVMAPIETAPRRDYRWAKWIGREIHRYSLVQHETKHADVVIHPLLDYGIAVDSKSVENRIRIGYESTQRMIPEIRRILVTV